MDDYQRPSTLVAGIARAKHLYAPWHGNSCHKHLHPPTKVHHSCISMLLVVAIAAL
jgi:hypothetical protein